MPVLQLAILVGTLIALTVPLVALEILADVFPAVAAYKGWLNILLWATVLALVYFVIAPVLGLAPRG